MTTPSKASDSLSGRIIADKYRVDRVLGQGAMGKVYLGEHLALARPVAIKVLHSHLARDPSLLKRFQREARAASRLNHPNSIQVLDFGQDTDESLYIVMEYLQGIDLRRLLKRDFPLAPQRVVHLLGQVLSALDEAHAQTVLHRDLKPENIFVLQTRADEEHVKVLDFGIAKIQDPREMDGQLTMAGLVCGTPEYMSPEQARGETLDARSDLYSVGVVLYQVLTGELPFKGESAMDTVSKHLTDDAVPPRQRRPDVNIDAGLESVCMRALSKDRRQRFETARDMKRAMEDALALGTEATFHAADLSGHSAAMPAPRTPTGGSGPTARTPMGGTPIGQRAPTGSGPTPSFVAGTRVPANPTIGAASMGPGSDGPMEDGPTSLGGLAPDTDNDMPAARGKSSSRPGTPMAWEADPEAQLRRRRGGLNPLWIAGAALGLLGGAAIIAWQAGAFDSAPPSPGVVRSAQAGTPPVPEARVPGPEARALPSPARPDAPPRPVEPAPAREARAPEPARPTEPPREARADAARPPEAAREEPVKPKKKPPKRRPRKEKEVDPGELLDQLGKKYR